MRRLLVAGFLGASVFGLSLGFGCGDDSTDGAGGGNSAIADVVYQGGATDEALEALLAVTPTASATQGANFTSPTNQSSVTANPPPTFTWAVGGGTGMREQNAPDRFLDDLRGRQPEKIDRRLSQAAGSLLGDFLSHERSAHAHGTPTSGAAYLLVFSTTTNDKVLRIFTTQTSYTPATAEIDKLKGVANENIRVQITNAQFDENRIAQDGGPFQGTQITINLML